MKGFYEILRSPRIKPINKGADGFSGMIKIPGAKRPAVIICSNGGGWDHVSISFSNRCPTWEEMCFVKDLCFGPEECVIQYHLEYLIRGYSSGLSRFGRCYPNNRI